MPAGGIEPGGQVPHVRGGYAAGEGVCVDAVLQSEAGGGIAGPAAGYGCRGADSERPGADATGGHSVRTARAIWDGMRGPTGSPRRGDQGAAAALTTHQFLQTLELGHSRRVRARRRGCRGRRPPKR